MSEETFDKSVTGYTLFGETLRKWSTDRKNAADEMGLLWPMIGEARWATWEETGKYPGMRKDVAIILWLLSLKNPSEQTIDDIKARAWTPDKAFGNPAKALDEAMQWLAGTSYSDATKKEFFQAANVALAIVLGVSQSEFSVEIDGEETEKKTESTNQPDGLV